MYIRASAKSAELQRATEFHVILPCHDGYPDAEKPFPTLYFLPGYSGNAEEIIFALPLRQMSAKYGIAVVIPDGENTFYTDHPERACRMGAYAGDELVRITRKLFPVLAKEREKTFIGGISMGGYGALALGLHYRETFSGLVLFSPAAAPDLLLNGGKKDVEGAVPETLFGELLGGASVYAESERLNPSKAVEAYLREGRKLPPVWMCCGEGDGLVGDACAGFRETLRTAGADLRWEAGKGGHDLMYWDDHLENAFRFLAEIA